MNPSSGKHTLLVMLLITVSVLFVGAGSFAIWSFNSRQDYKNNVDSKIAKAEEKAISATQEEDAKIYAEKAKEPFVNIRSNETYGSVDVTYPKTWNVYVDADGQGNSGIDWYFNPSFVPPINNSTFALRVQVTNTPYSAALNKFRNAKDVKIKAYKLPKMKDVSGTRIDGQISKNARGSLVLLPMRDKTISIWTESSSFAADFDKIILANITFVP